MCSISGYFSLNVNEQEVYSIANRMNIAMRHRGPDDNDITIVTPPGSSLALAHNRLSIIDISQNGHQPMRDPVNGNIIVFNGEIYNFLSLKKELENQGEIFNSSSDTEVLLRMYRIYGIRLLNKLRGIFAFAIWDNFANELILARDHLGVKPLYYSQQEKGFLFASEVRGLLASDAIQRNADYNSIRGYLNFGCVQEPDTLIRGIKSLPPGYYFKIVKGRLIERHCYWNISQIATTSATSASCEDSIRDRFQEVVNMQMIADVPVGVFLSGGIDSSAIASVAALNKSTQINTFCVKFDEAEFDESPFAAQIAAQINSKHHEIHISGESVQKDLTKLIQAYDQPSYDGHNVYFISKALKEHGLKVAHSGLGGDEIFVGYNGFKKALKVLKLSKLIGALPNWTKWKSQHWSVCPRKAIFWELRKNHKLLHAYFSSRLLFNSNMINWILPDIRSEVAGSWQDRIGTLGRDVDGLDSINQISALELQHYMLNQLLRDSDQMSMRHSLELRVPFLDHKLVEDVLVLPGSVKIDHLLPKALLIKSIKDILPAVSYSHPKQGFVFPFQKWFLSSMRQPLEEYYLSKTNSAIIDFSKRRKLWNAFLKGSLSWSRIWAIYLLESWLKNAKLV